LEANKGALAMAGALLFDPALSVGFNTEALKRELRECSRIALSALGERNDPLGDDFLHHAGLACIAQAPACMIESFAHDPGGLGIERIPLYQG
jgi:hypothetical protein